MPSRGKSRGVGKRNVGGGKKKHKLSKSVARTGFEARHLDQVWEDVRKQVNVVTKPDNTRWGPSGTTDRVELDADLPGEGKNYCTACSRYFLTPAVLATHERTKQHRRRVKTLRGARPHGQADADAAGGLGKPDNGPKLRTVSAQQPAAGLEELMQGLRQL